MTIDKTAMNLLEEAFLSGNKTDWELLQGNIKPNVDLLINDKTLENKDYSGWNFSRVIFTGCHFKKCNFASCKFQDVAFRCQCIFTDCNFSKIIFGRPTEASTSKWEGCEFDACTMHKMVIGRVSIKGTFKKCDMTGSKIENAEVQNVSFSNANLSGCSFRRTKFIKTLWDGAILDENTNFDQADFKSSHYSVTTDRSDRIKFNLKNKCSNWEWVRCVSDIPIFGVSWIMLGLALFVVNSIHTLNDKKFIKEDIINYDIPIPTQIRWIILSTILLAIGATIYRIKCPKQVQEFSVTEWVSELGHARPLYLVDTLKNPNYRYFCLTLMLAGGIIGACQIFVHLLDAILYISPIAQKLSDLCSRIL